MCRRGSGALSTVLDAVSGGSGAFQKFLMALSGGSAAFLKLLTALSGGSAAFPTVLDAVSGGSGAFQKLLAAFSGGSVAFLKLLTRFTGVENPSTNSYINKSPPRADSGWRNVVRFNGSFYNLTLNRASPIPIIYMPRCRSVYCFNPTCCSFFSTAPLAEIICTCSCVGVCT